MPRTPITGLEFSTAARKISSGSVSIKSGWVDCLCLYKTTLTSSFIRHQITNRANGILDCSQSPIFPWDRRCRSLSSTGRSSWSLDASETGERTHPYPLAYCTLPSFARINGSTSTSTIARKNRGLNSLMVFRTGSLKVFFSQWKYKSLKRHGPALVKKLYYKIFEYFTRSLETFNKVTNIRFCKWKIFTRIPQDLQRSWRDL